MTNKERPSQTKDRLLCCMALKFGSLFGMFGMYISLVKGIPLSYAPPLGICDRVSVFYYFPSFLNCEGFRLLFSFVTFMSVFRHH